MAKTGEQPGAGKYKCDNCGQIINLDSDTDRMPPCPNCNNTTFKKAK
ncbi:MAG: zinc ribbon-containing protein [Eubacteriaceae bacterium]|nr:zinc ribbon-containing protein [Eubacteriaceae bacterium]